MKLAVACLFALSAVAQNLPPINGTVVEYGSNAPIAAAEVILYEFVTIEGIYTRNVVSKIATDSRGAFTLKPEHPGSYFVEATKPTYLTAEELDALGPSPVLHRSELSLTITSAPVPDIQFILIRPGGLTGRVVDENDKPIPNFTVAALLNGIPSNLAVRAVTDSAGTFLYPALIPAPRTILAGPPNALPVSITYDLQAAADEEIESTYWPGGVTDPSRALPVDVVAGAVMDVGTIRVRNVRYYHAHVTYSGECDGEKWGATFVEGYGVVYVNCAKEFLLNRLTPGAHTLRVWVGNKKWAAIPFTIDRENIELALNFTPSTDIPVRVVNADGGKLPPLGQMRVRVGDAEAAAIDPQGNAMIRSVLWPRQQVSVLLPPATLAIKEFRYSNVPVVDGLIAAAPGSVLEIVVDEKPSSIAGTTDPSARIFLAKWPFVPTMAAPYQYFAQADESGRFEVGSLAAGEYRAVALRRGLTATQQLEGLLAAAPKITLERGAQKTIELKPSDAAR
ncbi:MAG: carboxypeptidase regulatory-like domain-containing protein [Bryobacteraceae bacterium]